MENNIQPLNDLEVSLLSAKEKVISIKSFLHQVLISDIALPTAKEVQANGVGFEPILFEKNGIKMMAAFTDKTRVLHLSHIAKYCLMMKGLELLKRMPKGYGLVINPGIENISLDISPEGISQIIEDMGYRG
jgi:hypothetical protein